MPNVSLCVIILTFNEEIHIQRAIESVNRFASEIWVVDSFSTDRTADIVKSLGANLIQNKFVTQSQQFQWALENLEIQSDWIMRLDADEVIEIDLQNEIMEKLPQLNSNIVGVNLKRKHIFLDKWIKYGGRYPLILTRIWRKGHGAVEDRWMDEHVYVWGGEIVTFRSPFRDHNLKDITYFVSKHNVYATREAIDVIVKKHNLSPPRGRQTENLLTTQARWKRTFKTHIFNKIPFSASAFLYFIFRMFFQFGFLDGKEGIIYHFLQGCWYRFLVGAKILEYETALKCAEDNEEKLEILANATGMRIS